MESASRKKLDNIAELLTEIRENLEDFREETNEFDYMSDNPQELNICIKANTAVDSIDQALQSLDDFLSYAEYTS